MTRKGTIEKLKALGKWLMAFADKLDSIMGKIKWLGIAATLVLSFTHWKACNDRDFYEKQYTKVKPK